MKQFIRKISFILLVTGLITPASLLAQKEEKEKEVKEMKEKKEGEQIIITRKGGKDEKIVVEVVGDKIIVNGKELKDQEENGDVTVRRHKIKDVWAFGGRDAFAGTWPGGENFRMFDMDESRAMLGVTTEQADGGVEIQTITKESAAEKAGLKKGDVIKKIGDKIIESPDDLSETIQDHKPGDKVTITFLRDKKEQKITTELGKWKGAGAFSLGSTGSNRFNLQQLEGLEDQLRSIPRVAVPGMNWNWSGSGGPKLGLSVQDTEDGKGVNVIEVDEDGNAAKAGIKEDDIITDVDGKAVNSTDEISKLIKESKEKTSVKVKLLRGGKAETVEVKIPRKLKTTDL